ncbi:LOW QUALITY PROTEIN: alpha-protein kinase 3-like [Lampetra planeri]
MTSRRPMTRSYSGNGRTSSFSEEEGSSSNGRSESRNTYLSNVRPENRYSHYRPTRSTLCSVMAQLTEDIQPSFETTLKSKAVSENCNVKFTCVVSGYPAPELKWYKDDTEMDRYCGLPKYEIRRNGKTHTLHIYNCTLDDAAIYQVSASNSKGIVSCSGVLEVGTMSEYQIHQRFFAKLKQKAEKKRKDTEEHSKKQAKEDIHKEKPQVSPERPQRKRPILEPKQIQAVKEPEVVEQLGSEPNGVTAEVKETHPVASSGLNPEKELQPSVDVLATKKMKITNNIDGVNSSSSRNHVMGNGGENCYDGGISLAHFLAETLHSQAAEEIQNSKEVDKTIVNVTEESEREKERQQNEREEEKAPEEEHEREKELTVEREKEIERLLEMVQTADNQRHGSEVKHHRKGHKDHDHHNIQASISSMLHTVKDFFFGKGKRDPREPIEKKEKEFDHSLSQTPPPSYWLQPEHRGEVDKPQPEVVPMETELQMPVAIEHQSVPLEVETTHEDSVPHTDPPPAHESHLESKEEPVVHSVKEVETLVQAMEAEAQSSGPGEEMASSALLTEQAEENDSLMVLLPHPQGPDCLVVSPHPVEVVESTLSEDVSVSPKSQAASEEEGLPPTSNLRNPVECQQTETESSAERPRGTEHGVAKDMTTKPEQTEKDDEKPEGRKRAISSLKAHEALTQMIEVKSIRKTPDDNTAEVPKTNPPKEPKIENSVTVEDLLRNRSSVERLSTKPPTSPASLRKFVSKVAPDSEIEVMTSVPVITVDDHQSDRVDEDLSGGSTPTSSLSCESSPRLKRRDSLSLIRSATPEELASGARRKIFLTKSKEDGDGVGTLDTQSKRESPYMSPSQTRRAALLQPPMGQNTPPMERRSPLVSRRKATLDVPKVVEQAQTEEKPAEKKFDPLKAPQVIRKIRGEPFPDASGHLKLWCQFFNVLSDSTIKWFRDEEEILEVKRSGGDESQVALAIVLASSQDCGVYGCTIQNEYGTDTTDFLLSVDILSEILLKDDLEVGEEIEMTPLLFNKGLANSGSWGDKYFGRIMTETVHIGEGCVHKASRVKVIYGLSPVFESGSTCIVKVQNPIAYGTRQESNLAERNVTITQQECKIQNMIREYCKIFAAEARVIDNFGASIEVIPQYLMYRPANSVPFATVEADLSGVFLKYCMTDPKGRLITRSVSEVEQKCCTFQHWIYQWTHGNLLVTRLEGVGMKITNIKVVTKSKGYQGLTDSGSPEVLEQFVTHHQCNYYCGLIGLRPLKTADSLQQPTKVKGSRSPLLNRKLGQGSCSPQLQRKGQSPQMSRKANCSPKVVRKVQESGDNKSGSKEKPTEPLDVLETR